MKKVIFILSLSLYIQNAQAQYTVDTAPWCPPGATWVYGTLCQSCYAGYIEFKYVKDTTFLNSVAKVLTVRNIVFFKDPLSPDPLQRLVVNLPNEYVYSSSDSVYLFSDTAFQYVYSFNHQIGDSFKIVNARSYCRLDSSFPNIDTATVTSIANDTIGGLIIKKYNIKSKYINTGGPNNGEGVLFENIGFPTSLFPEVNYQLCNTPVSSYSGNGWVSGLICYSDNIRGTLSFQANPTVSCHGIKTHIPDMKNLSTISLYPNPTNSDVFIEIEDDTPSSVILYDMIGKKILEKPLDENNTSLNNISTGVYLIGIIGKSKKIYQQKLIID